MSYLPANSHYHLPRMKEMGRVYWCHSVGILGIQLAAIFVSIFLLKSGYSFREVLVFLLLQQVLSVALQYPVNKLFAYVRPHYLLAIGRIWFAIFFCLLATLNEHHWPLALLALFWALDRTMYWSAFHYVFSMARAHKHGNRQIAGINALAILAATAAPAIGGVIATVFGINYTYIVAVLFIMLAAIPMITADKGPERTKIQIPRHEIKAMRPDMLANMFNGTVVAAEQNIWPMFVFLIVTSYAGIGALSSVIAAASVGVMLYVGRHEEVRGDQHYIKQGMAAYSLASVGRVLVQSTTQVFGLNMLSGIGRSLYVTPFMNRYYLNSDGEHKLGYITIMETAFEFGSVLYILALLALTLLFSASTVLAIGLGIVAVSVLGVRLIR
ncbi:MAG: hypothetical protein AAB436_03225 [Patescibacteria group bacterium]